MDLQYEGFQLSIARLLVSNARYSLALFLWKEKKGHPKIIRDGYVHFRSSIRFQTFLARKEQLTSSFQTT